MTSLRDIHVIYDESGRILSIADAAEFSGPGGVVLSHHPVLRPGQFTVRVGLDGPEQESAALLRDYEVDTAASPPRLRRRTAD